MKIILRLVLISLAIFIPVFSFGFEVGNIISVVSLLFAILAGFFIAATTSNYLQHQSLIALENAQLITIAQLVNKVDPDNFKTVAKAIDDYLIATLDYDLLTYHQGTQHEFDQLFLAIDKVNPGTGPQASLYQNLHSAKAALLATWQETRLTAQTIVGPLHWLIIGSLALLTSLLLLSLRDGSFLAGLITGVLILGVFEVLELIHTIDTNVFLATKLSYESPQQVFAALNKPNYYPEFVIARKRKLGLLPSVYRVGLYKGSDATGRKVIKTIGSPKRK